MQMRLATNWLKMKAFWKVLKRFAAPYKKYLAGSVVLNLFSAIFIRPAHTDFEHPFQDGYERV